MNSSMNVCDLTFRFSLYCAFVFQYLESIDKAIKLPETCMYNIHSQGVSSVDWMEVFFIARSFRTDEKCCVCNYNHRKTNVSNSNETWNLDKHTELKPTDYYGILPQSNSPVHFYIIR